MDERGKTKKPTDSAFKQQRLPAWQPILTAGTVLPTFFVIGIAFIPIGIGLLYFSDEVKEISIDYTNCNESLELTSNKFYDSSRKCSDIVANDSNTICMCRIPFTLNRNFDGNVFMYYGLTNFYQNHRRYVKSRDDRQLLGHLSNEPISDCAPFDKIYNNDTMKMQAIVPCGAIANSLFSDELALYTWTLSNKRDSVPLVRTGIAWESDKNIKFRNPPGDNLRDAFKNYAKPLAWKKFIWELDDVNPNNNGFQNEDLIVWMRTAALPTFRKLYRRIDHSVTAYKDGLIKGKYELWIKYTYDVSQFGGGKRMILSTTSLIGGKNPFLGIAYIAVGCICLIFGVMLLIVHIKYGKSTTEMINVTPRTSYK